MNIKAVVFDMDGMVVGGERFSVRLDKEHGIRTDVTLPFFKGVFQKCLVGRADLKEELQKLTGQWGWKGTVEELLEFWFNDTSNPVDRRFEPAIDQLRKKGILCYLATNNEKYRTAYLMKRIGKNFDGIFSSSDIGFKKPESKFFACIGERAGVLKEEIMYWDDDAENLEKAKEFGFQIELYTNFESFLDKVTPLINDTPARS